MNGTGAIAFFLSVYAFGVRFEIVVERLRFDNVSSVSYRFGQSNYRAKRFMQTLNLHMRTEELRTFIETLFTDSANHMTVWHRLYV